MGCGVSKFKQEEAELSNDSQPNNYVDDDQQSDAHKYGLISVSLHPIINNQDSEDHQVVHEKALNELDEDDQLEKDCYADRRDCLKYPGSPSFRVYCDPEVVHCSKPSRPKNNIGNNIFDHVAKKKSYLSRNMDERVDVDKGLGAESSVVKKESRVRRLTGAILRSSQQRKSLHQKS